LPRSRGPHAGRLNGLVENLDSTSKEILLNEVFPTKLRKRKATEKTTTVSLKRAEIRRQVFARTQKFFKKSPSRCIKGIHEGVATADPPAKSNMVGYWKTMFEERASANTESIKVDDRETSTKLWEIIAVEEIKRFCPANSSTLGPHMLYPRELKNTDPRMLEKIYNLIVWCE